MTQYLAILFFLSVVFGDQLYCYEQGIDVRSGLQSTNSSSYSTESAMSALDAALNLGSSSVRLHQTFFVQNVRSPAVRRQSCNSFGRRVTSTCTEADSDIQAAIKHATDRQVTVTLSLRVEPDWEVPANYWQPEGPGQWYNRRVVGRGFSVPDWDTFFANLTALAMESADLLIASAPNQGSCLEVGAGLDTAYSSGPSDLWYELIANLKRTLDPHNIELRVPISDYLLISPSTRAAGSQQPPAEWLDSLPSLTVTSWSPLIPWGASNDSVASFQSAWTAIADSLGAVSSSLGGKPIVLAEFGFYSRWRCWERPNATVVPNIPDCARHADCYHMACQTNGLEGVFQALQGRSWLKGVYVYGMTTDPSLGGTYEWSHTPHGKPAEATIRRWYGNYTEFEYGPFHAMHRSGFRAVGDSASNTQHNRSMPDHADVRLALELGAIDEDDPPLELYDAKELHVASQTGALHVAAAVALSTRGAIVSSQGSEEDAAQGSSQATEEDAAQGSPQATEEDAAQGLPWLKPYDGAIFGTGQYGNPLQQVNGPLTKVAIANAKATGMRSIEIMVAWFETTENDTEQYPITDPSNPMMTVPDPDLEELLQYAKSQGFNVILTPFLDFNFFDTRACHRVSPYVKCPWRGDIGIHFGDNCSAGSQWDKWWSSYGPLVLHYAALAETSGVDLFLVEHELWSAAFKCTDRWRDLVRGVRKVFSRKVGAAFNYFILDDGAEQQTQWVKDLDVVGVDIYAYYQATWHKAVNGTYGPLPWQQSPMKVLEDAARTLVREPIDRLANWTGIDVMATENGFGSRPFGYGAAPNDYMGLPFADNCDVHARCYSMEAQAMGYQAIRTAMEGASYWQGINLWTMHNDPTIGGPSDSTKCPIGKPLSLQAAFGKPSDKQW